MSAQYIQQADVATRVSLAISAALSRPLSLSPSFSLPVCTCRIRNVVFCSYFDKSVGNAAGPAAAQVSVGGEAGQALLAMIYQQCSPQAHTHSHTHSRRWA